MAEQNGKFAPVNSNGHSRVQPLEVLHSIVHIIPGRVRFRVPRLLHDTDYAQRLQVLTEADAQVTSIRINRAAASVVIFKGQDAIASERSDPGCQ